MIARRITRLPALGAVVAGLTWATISCARHSPVEQPVAFSHRAHVEKKLRCTFCHAGAEKHAQATLPSVTLCMSCHSAIKADSPEVLKAKAYLDRREEIPWIPIYKLPREADVFFNHHRHAAAGVVCSSCHGEVEARDVLAREIDLNMGFCVECHDTNRKRFRDERLAADCVTCHR